MEYPYFKGLEADRYSFYRVPKALVKADLFQKMSGDETGRDMMDKYKETAQGGIALLYEESGEFGEIGRASCRERV